MTGKIARRSFLAGSGATVGGLAGAGASTADEATGKAEDGSPKGAAGFRFATFFDVWYAVSHGEPWPADVAYWGRLSEANAAFLGLLRDQRSCSYSLWYTGAEAYAAIDRVVEAVRGTVIAIHPERLYRELGLTEAKP